MDMYNPYVSAIAAGVCVYLYTYNFSNKTKEKRQTNLNYVFLTSVLVFIMMNYYGSNTSSIEPTLSMKFDE